MEFELRTHNFTNKNAKESTKYNNGNKNCQTASVTGKRQQKQKQ